MTRQKILLADDSVTIRKVIELTFAEEGVDVYSVPDGDSAMQKFVEIEPDLVIADVNMPGMGGYQICEMIKQDESTRDIPVILLVGSFEPFDPGEASRVGCNYYFTKPFQSIRDLVAKVKEYLELGSFDSKTPETVDIDDLYHRSIIETPDIEPGSEFAIPESEKDLTSEAELEPEDEVETIESTEAVSGSEAEMADEASIEPQDDVVPIDSTEAVTETQTDLSYEDSGSDESVGTGELAAETIADHAVTIDPFDATVEMVIDSEPVFERVVDDPEPIHQAEPVDLGDAGMDDEIIETSRPGGDEIPAYRSVSVDPFEVPADQFSPDEARPSESVAGEVAETKGFEFSQRFNAPLRLVIDDENETGEKEEEVEEAAQPETQAADSGLTPTTASPELIEMIARRVIERLSDTAVREVALETVPQIAEKLIREALEAESKT